MAEKCALTWSTVTQHSLSTIGATNHAYIHSHPSFPKANFKPGNTLICGSNFPFMSFFVLCQLPACWHRLFFSKKRNEPGSRLGTGIGTVLERGQRGLSRRPRPGARFFIYNEIKDSQCSHLRQCCFYFFLNLTKRKNWKNKQKQSF